MNAREAQKAAEAAVEGAQELHAAWEFEHDRAEELTADVARLTREAGEADAVIANLEEQVALLEALQERVAELEKAEVVREDAKLA